MTVRRTKQTRRKRVAKNAKPKTKVDKKLSRRITRLEKSVEIKYHDSTSTTAPTPSGNIYSLIDQITDGNNYNERIGDRINLKYVRMAFRIAVTPTPVSIPYVLRLILLVDNQFNANGAPFQISTGTTPTSTELATALFDDRDGQILTIAPYNQNTVGGKAARYSILWDKKIINKLYTTQVEQVIEFQKKINLHNMLIRYADSNVGPTTLGNKNLLFLYFNSYTALNPYMESTHRVFYSDS